MNATKDQNNTTSIFVASLPSEPSSASSSSTNIIPPLLSKKHVSQANISDTKLAVPVAPLPLPPLPPHPEPSPISSIPKIYKVLKLEAKVEKNVVASTLKTTKVTTKTTEATKAQNKTNATPQLTKPSTVRPSVTSNAKKPKILHATGPSIRNPLSQRSIAPRNNAETLFGKLDSLCRQLAVTTKFQYYPSHSITQTDIQRVTNRPQPTSSSSSSSSSTTPTNYNVEVKYTTGSTSFPKKMKYNKFPVLVHQGTVVSSDWETMRAWITTNQIYLRNHMYENRKLLDQFNKTIHNTKKNVEDSNLNLQSQMSRSIYSKMQQQQYHHQYQSNQSNQSSEVNGYEQHPNSGIYYSNVAQIKDMVQTQQKMINTILNNGKNKTTKNVNKSFNNVKKEKKEKKEKTYK